MARIRRKHRCLVCKKTITYNHDAFAAGVLCDNCYEAKTTVRKSWGLYNENNGVPPLLYDYEKTLVSQQRMKGEKEKPKIMEHLQNQTAMFYALTAFGLLLSTIFWSCILYLIFKL